MKNIWNIILLALLLTGCGPKVDEKPMVDDDTVTGEHKKVIELTSTQYETVGIETGSFSMRQISDVVNANGTIDIPPQNLVSISAPLGGFIRKTELLQGMKVRKGETLAVIENPEFIQIQQDYLETVSTLEYANLELARQTQLSKENVNALKTLQQATLQVKTQKARLAGLEEKLKTVGIDMGRLQKGIISNSTPIVSPISGSVTTVNVNLGKYVNPTDVMFEIVDTEHLHVELSVFEQDIPKIKLGQLVRFSVSNNPGKEDLAKVYLINQKINEDRTVRVHCHLTEEDHNLLPQNFVKAIIETGTNLVPALPDQAVVDFEGASYIFVEKADSDKKNPAFDIVEVTRGAAENGFTEVKFPAGFDIKNTRIVLKGAYSLLSKLKNTEEEH